MEIAKVNLSVTDDNEISMGVTDNNEISLSVTETASAGTTDYNRLANKPSINGVMLQGDKTASDLGVLDSRDEITNATVTSMWNAIVD